MSQVFKIGDHVQFDHKGKSYNAEVIRMNKKTYSLRLENGGKARVSPFFLRTIESTVSFTQTKKHIAKPSFTSSNIYTQTHLETLCNDVKMKLHAIVENIFTTEEVIKFNNVQVRWGQRDTYRNCGWYRPSQNLIQITKSFKNASRRVIEATMWHELLHIHFTRSQGRQAHSRDFRFYEKQYPEYTEARKETHKLMIYLRSILS